MLRKNGNSSIIGGLFIVFNARIPDRFLQKVSHGQILPNTLFMENTTIKENRAQRTGGMGILSLNSPVNTKRIENLVLFKSCKFFGNESPNGAAFAFQNLVHSGFDPSTSIIFEDVSIEQNRQTESSSINTAVAYLSSVNLTIRGKSQFIENVGIALLLSESIITVEGDLRFINNSGIGISLLGLSNIVLRSGSALVFKGNRAANKGGAILSDLYPSYTNLSRIIYDCFLWFEELSRDCRFFGYCQNVPQPNATIVFEDNHAPVGGTIYGSTLSTCPWAVYPNGTKPSSGVAFLQQLPSVTFNPSVLDSSVVSTDAFYLVRNISQHIYAIPGKEMDLNITALDLFNQSVSTTIRSSFLNTTRSRSQLGNSGNWHLNPNDTVPITFFGEPGDTLLASIFTIDTNATLEVSVTLDNCSFGFILSGNQKCLCDTDLPSQVTCNQQNFELQVPSHEW